MERRSQVVVLGGRYIKDIVYAANDGIITTFAVVAGVVGANQEVSIVIILGLANLIGDGISMASGNFLGSRSEYLYYLSEKDRIKSLIKHQPVLARREIRKIYSRRGFKGSFLTEIVAKITDNNQVVADELAMNQFKSQPPESTQPLRAALATFVSFLVFGFIPLTPFLAGINNSFFVSVVATGCSLFLVGSLRSIITGKSWLLAGLEMLAVGAVASASAYWVGYLIAQIVSS